MLHSIRSQLADLIVIHELNDRNKDGILNYAALKKVFFFCNVS